MPSDFWAFFPAPLEVAFPLDAGLALLLSETDAAVGELSGIGRHLPNPELLIAPYSRREAVLSSRIEGTQASMSELLFDELKFDEEVAQYRPRSDDDVREVRNYVRALRLGIARLAELPIATRLILEIHRELLKGESSERHTPGEFRRSQNWIGPPGSTPATAPYVPPPPGETMLDCIADWERFTNTRGQLPDLIQCALLHERFEAIHPFLDGNGRIGRLLVTLFLIERGRLSHPLLYLSAFIEAHRAEYYDLLQRVRTHYDRRAWVIFFLNGVRQTARQAIQHTRQILDMRARWRHTLSGDHRSRALLDSLFVNPYVTVASSAKILRVSQPTAARTIQRLVESTLLSEITGNRWGKVFLAAPILNVIENPPVAENG